VRLAYVFDGVAEHGVNRKIAAQLREWNRSTESRAFYLAPQGMPMLDAPASRFEFRSLLDRRRATNRLVRALDAYGPDLVYVRYDLFLPGVWRAIRRHCCVVEVNTNDVRELASRASTVRAYNRVNRWAVFGAAVGLVAVTRELAELELGRGFAGEVAVVGNGLDSPDAFRTDDPARRRGAPRVLFVGLAQPWHGVDRLLDIARRLPHVRFDLVGVGSADSAPPNVTCHGPKAPGDYDDLLAAARAGIGPLALERTGLREASPLKVRDYLLHGLPVVIAHRDPDLSGRSLPYVLELPVARDVDADAAAIDRFLESVRDVRVTPGEAEALVGIGKKESLRVEFMRRVAAGRPARRRSAWNIRAEAADA
jgi:glycosyltransferase involved in cell wall biosynthesis